MSFDEDGELADGIGLLQSGDNAGAASRFARIIEMNPMNDSAFAYLGVAQNRLGYLDASIASMQEAARLKPGDTASLYNLAIALRQSNRSDEARAALQRVLAIDPTHAHARSAIEALPPPAAPIENTFVESPAIQGITPMGLPPLPQAPPSGMIPPVPPVYNAPVGIPGVQPMGGYPQRGMVISPEAMPSRPMVYAPSVGIRIGRGLGWGALYGQWWTLLIVLFDGILYGGGLSNGSAMIGLVEMAIGLAIVFALIGGLAGFIIGAANLAIDQATAVGIVFGLLLLGVEYYLTGSARSLVNILFWGFSGRGIGRSIGGRVQTPVSS